MNRGRKRRLALSVLLILVSSTTLSVAGDSPGFVELEIRTLDNLPNQGKEPRLDMADGYLGICSSDLPTNRFVLFDPEGKEAFSVESPQDAWFMMVDMRSSPGIVALGAVHIGEFLLYQFYDYTGELIAGPIETGGAVRPSPGGSYLYTRPSPAKLTYARIFDRRGGLLATLETHTDYWQMTAIDDSLLLFQNGNKIQVLLVPSMSIVNEFEVSDIAPPRQFLSTSLSPDGRFYGFNGLHKIAVCNVLNGEIRLVHRNEDRVEYPPGLSNTPRLVLSEGAEQVICYDPRGVLFTAYEFDGSEYHMVVDEVKVLVGAPVYFAYKEPFFMRSICVFNHWARMPNTVTFSAYAFNFKDISLHLTSGETLPGYAARSHVGGDATLHVVGIDTDQPHEAVVRSVSWEETEHE